VVIEVKVPNTWLAWEAFLKRFEGKAVTFLCEACNKSFWFVDMIQSVGYEVKVADSYRLKIISEAKSKTDRLDARVLSELLWKDYLTEVYVGDRWRRMLKDYMRARVVQMRERVKYQTRLRHYADRYGIEERYDRDREGERSRAYVKESYPDVMRETIESYVRMIEALREEEKKILRRIGELIKEDEGLWRDVQLLRSIPGIGEIASVMIALEIDKIERFKNPKKLWSYAGLVPRVRQSGKRERYGRIVKRGNGWLRWIMIECAWMARRGDSYYEEIYRKQRLKRSSAESIVPVARMLLSAVWKVLKEQRTYGEIYSQSFRSEREGKGGSKRSRGR
jgi:transposase